MQILKQIIWRIRFLFFYSWGMNYEVILYTLLPSYRNNLDFRTEILEKKGIIEYKKDFHTILLNGLEMHFGKKIPATDLISIFLYHHVFVQKNFIHNPAFHFEGPYEKDDVTLHEGDIVVDAGANIGLFSLLASQKIGTEGTVLAFEPVQEAKEILAKNITENNLSNITIAPYALGETISKITFSLDDGLLGSSSVFKKGAKTEEVDQTTLDHYVAAHNIPRVDFIKADIEGAERDFIKGAEQTLKQFKPRLAICIYHLPDDPEVIEGLLSSFVPEYTFTKTATKIFAHV